MEEMRNTYRVLVVKPVGRPRRTWENNIRMDLRELGCEDRRWTRSAKHHVRWWALVLAILNLQVLVPEC